MEPASQQLNQRLSQLGLNPQRDLRDCQPIVRRLSRDLPTFDSVWIDALVQLRRLTPFQARHLENADGRDLRIGPIVLQNALEPGDHCHTYLAKHVNKSEPCVIKLLSAQELPHNAFDQLEQLAARLKSISHPSIIGPHACLRENGNIITVSRNTVGRTVQELMVRRGRFSPSIVAEIGRQLVDGLAALETKNIRHGDICMANLRLNDRGAATLVDTGIRSLTESNPDLHSELPLRKLEGLAPERIGSGKTADTKSDLYSLGCLLWRLLCGRPVFLTADPLALIAAHRTKDIVDVREWSPDTPAWLAEFIRHAVRREPASRPQSFAAVGKNWGKPRRSGRRQLKRFQASFDRVPASTKSKSRFIPITAAGLLVAAGAAVAMNSDRMPQLLNLSRSTNDVSVQTSDAPKTVENTGVAHSISNQQIPEPDANGQIVLRGGTYPARNINFAGHLQLISEDGGATVVIDSDTMKLAAAEISLTGIHIVDRRNLKDPGSANPALQIQSQSLTVTAGSFRSTSPSQKRAAFVSWQAEDRHDRSSGRISVQDCGFVGNATAFRFLTAPTVVGCENTVKAGQGPMLDFHRLPTIGHECQLTIRDTTLRNSGALIQLHSNEAEQHGLISVRHSNCVFAMTSGRSLIETYADSLKADQTLAQFEIERSAESSLLRSGINDSVWLNPKTRSTGAMPTGTVRISGLATTEITFAKSGTVFDQCVVKNFAAPRRSTKAPGADVARLADSYSKTR